MQSFFKKYSSYFFYVLFGILAVQGFLKSGEKSDFGDYFQASKYFYEKKDLYNKNFLKSLQTEIKPEEIFKAENLEKLEMLKGNVGTYIYPPVFAFLLIPLGFLDYSVASAIFLVINLAFLYGCFYYLKLNFDSEKFSQISFLTLLIGFKFFENHVANNQVAFVLLFLCIYSLFSKNEILSGLAIAVAIWIKLTPAIFLVYFLFQKEYKKIFYCAIFGVLILFLPSIYSHDYNIASLIDWKELVLDKAMKNPEFRSWKNNQSLISTLAKYFLPNADLLNQSEHGLPILNLSKESLKLLFYFLSALIFLPIGIYFLKNKNKEKMISILFILSVVFSGISWIHSFVFLLFPIFYLLKIFLETKQEKYFSYFFYLVLILSIFINKSLIGQKMESKLLMFSYLLYLSLAYLSLVIKINTNNERN